MTNPIDHYQVLNVTPTASDDDIKKAFRKLAKEFHPDKNSGEGAEEKFKAVLSSYEFLSSHGRREVYDRERTRAAAPKTTTNSGGSEAQSETTRAPARPPRRQPSSRPSAAGRKFKFHKREPNRRTASFPNDSHHTHRSSPRNEFSFFRDFFERRAPPSRDDWDDIWFSSGLFETFSNTGSFVGNLNLVRDNVFSNFSLNSGLFGHIVRPGGENPEKNILIDEVDHSVRVNRRGGDVRTRSGRIAVRNEWDDGTSSDISDDGMGIACSRCGRRLQTKEILKQHDSGCLRHFKQNPDLEQLSRMNNEFDEQMKRVRQNRRTLSK